MRCWSRTRVRARLATWRQASGLRSTASAISPNGTPNTSAITNTARSIGVSDSSTRRNPNVSDSASSARWAGSAPGPVGASTATTGSGSHGPDVVLAAALRGPQPVERQP